MPGHDLTVWGMVTVRQLRPHWMLAEMGLEYEYFPVHPRSGETMQPEFLKINPRHKVPVLRHGKMIITESAAILQYVSEAFSPPPGFHVPREAVGRAKLNEWCFFIMSELDATALYTIRRHLGLKHIYGEAPRAVEEARKYFSEQLGAIADRVGQASPFLLADGFSVADILMGTCLDWALDEKIVLPDPVATYRERLIQRPAYQAAYKKAYQG